MSSILLADDHSLVRVGLAALLDGTDDLRVVGQAENGRGAVEPAAELRPDVILMDLSMPVMDGVEATREHPRAAGAPARQIGVSDRTSAALWAREHLPPEDEAER